MGESQRKIQEKIDLGELVSQCCVTGKVRDHEGNFVGFRFQEQYANVSHTYCNEIYQDIRAMIHYHYDTKKKS